MRPASKGIYLTKSEEFYGSALKDQPDFSPLNLIQSADLVCVTKNNNSRLSKSQHFKKTDTDSCPSGTGEMVT